MLSRKKAKKVMENYKKHAVAIKCEYCYIKADCSLKPQKEKSEKMGIRTFCTLTPNRPRHKHKNISK